MDPSTFTESRQCYVQFNSAVARMLNLYESVYKRIYGNSSSFLLDRTMVATAIKANPGILIQKLLPILYQYKDEINVGDINVVFNIDFFKVGKDDDDILKIKKHETICKRLLAVATEDEKANVIETSKYMLELCYRYEILSSLNK